MSTADYLPPRAGGGATMRVTRTAITRMAINANQRAEMGGRFVRSLFSAEVDWAAMRWSVIPGLGHVHAGFRRFGFAMTGIWLLLLAMAIANAGGSGEWFWYLLTVGFHCFVVTLLLSRALQKVPTAQRLLAGLFVYTALNCLMYLPARWAARNIATPVRITNFRKTDLISNGDTVVHQGPWLRPQSWQRGDLVFYRIRRATAPGVIVAEGYGLDRIVAVGGDEVRVTNGHLFVNGIEANESGLPLAGIVTLHERFHIRVSDGEYLIVPSALTIAGQGAAFDNQRRLLLEGVSRVSAEDVLGKVWLRLRPWSRFGTVE